MQDQKGPDQVKAQGVIEARGPSDVKVDGGDESKEKLLNVVCFNCGETGYYSFAYAKPRVCFICHQCDHVVDKCPKWGKV